MPTHATHDELINPQKFNVKFKNALRDYYSYGFKNINDLKIETSEQTLVKDWNRLNHILQDYVEWSDKKKRKEVMYITQDSEKMDVNPFHRLYRFCLYPEIYPAYFFHTMAALSPHIHLQEGVETLSFDSKKQKYLEKKIEIRDFMFGREVDQLHLSEKEKDNLSFYYYEKPDRFMQELRKYDLGDEIITEFEDILQKKIKLKTSDLIYFFTDKVVNMSGKNKNKTPNHRLTELQNLGLINCERAENKKDDHKWVIGNLTLSELLTEGSKVNSGFKQHFQAFMDFFSKYFLMGEIGTFLLDRIELEEDSPFRFKHEYFMQSLNDVNLIDLIYAIEKKYWCRIQYRHGVSKTKTELLCYPLELRISSATGREYLMYYEPFKRSYAGLRLEFIDSIEYYREDKILEVLEKETQIYRDDIRRDCENARWSLKYSWGISTATERKQNAVNKTDVNTVKMRILYDTKTEYYIKNRMLRERRNGQVTEVMDPSALDYSVEVSDIAEMKPWIRSFYSRVSSFDVSSKTFSIESDILTFTDYMRKNEFTKPEDQAGRRPGEAWKIPQIVVDKLGNGHMAREHEKLFHEIFSIYYHVMADVFVQLCSQECTFTEKELKEIISNSLGQLSFKLGSETNNILMEQIKTLFLTRGFVTEEDVNVYKFRYYCDSDVNFYRDIVPLTELEIRWLKTAVKDEKAQYFLDKEEIKILEQVLQEHFSDIKAFPMQKIIYYDRYKFPKEKAEKEAESISIILECINKSKRIHMTYRTNYGNIKVGEYIPVVLEFSKRNNKFQLYAISTEGERISTFNLSSITTLKEIKKSFDDSYTQTVEKFENYRNKRSRYIDIKFYNKRNLADRILMELSPWKKKCICDRNRQLYSLRVYYQPVDEVDLVVRLMGYGKAIYIDTAHSIGNEIRKRMEQQSELLKIMAEENHNENTSEKEPNR